MKNAIKEAKEECSWAYEAGFRHYGRNYRMHRDTETNTWLLFRCVKHDIHDTLIGAFSSDYLEEK